MTDGHTSYCKVKSFILHHPEQGLATGQVSRPNEMVPIRTISTPSEGGRKPQGENHQALAVKGEDIPHVAHCLSQTQYYHGATRYLPTVYVS